MAKVKTSIEPAVAAKLSYRNEATISRSTITIVGDSGRTVLTRTEFEKLRQADDVFKGDLELGDGLMFRADGPIKSGDAAIL